MIGRTTWSFLVSVLAIMLVLAAAVVMLVVFGLRQSDILHQIILVGLGVLLLGLGVILLALAVGALSRDARGALRVRTTHGRASEGVAPPRSA